MNDASPAKPVNSKSGRYFEDYPVGAVFTGGPISVSEQDILDFVEQRPAAPVAVPAPRSTPAPAPAVIPGDLVPMSTATCAGQGLDHCAGAAGSEFARTVAAR